MSFNPPEGILDIGNATLRVGKLEVSETLGLNQGLQNIVKNNLLITETTSYTTNQKWGLKLPTTWVAEFEVKGHTGKYIDFNFYNENSASNAQGYNLTFKDTTMTLRYDGGNPLPITGDTVDSTLSSGDAGYGVATIPTIVGAFRKVNIFFERGVLAVSIDGTRYLYFRETDGYNQGVGAASRVVSATGGAFVNLFIEANAADSAFKNLRIVNDRFISDKTSNIAFVGGNLGVGVNSPQEALDIRGNMHFERVSNVSQIKVSSNVVAEYTGPHDRPLRKYPDVAMTVNSIGGYVASASSNQGNYEPYEAFNGIPNTELDAWRSLATYTTSTGDYGVTTHGVMASGTQYYGEWLQIKLPTRVKIEYIHYWPQPHPSLNLGVRGPGDGVLVGSNDGTTWYTLKRFTGISLTTGQYTQIYTDTNMASYYNYFRLLCDNTAGGGSYDTEFAIGELELYGHEEGDSSLDTTLKSVYNVPGTTGTQLEVYYDAKDLTTMPSTVTDLSPNSNDGSPTDVSVSDGAFVFNGTSSLLEKTSLSIPGGDNPLTFSFWVKNDDFDNNQYIFRLGINQTTYQTIALYKNSSNQFIFATWTLDFPIDYTFTSNQWNHISLVYPGGGWKQTNLIAYVDGKPYTFGGNVSSGGVGGTVMSLATSLTLRLGGFSSGSTIFDGSIANFRLFSKALNADQVKELYDYQKDYFLGSKSQVTLYKGHLGIGVTEPSGQLELAGDERIQQYPPRGMTDFDTYIEGHGVFTASASSQHSGSFDPWGAFSDTNDYNIDIWVSGNNEWSTTDGTPTVLHYLSDNTPGGAWLKIEMPNKIKLNSFSFVTSSRNYSTETFPENFQIWASNNGTEWNQIYSVSGFGNPPNETGGTSWGHTNVNSQTYYSMYAMVITKLYAVGSVTRPFATIPRWELFGTPGPTTLDKGSLSLTRSLDVPRISRYDVDTETPRPEKLLVDFDTTVNSSPTDISGQGNHGTMTSGVSYSAADKAFKWDSSTAGRHIKAVITNTDGSWPHSTSFWFKAGSLASTQIIYGIVGDPDGTDGSPTTYSTPHISLNTNGTITLNIWGDGAVTIASVIQVNRWYHISITFDSTAAGRKLYVDGVLAPLSSTPAHALSMVGTTSHLIIGIYPHNSIDNPIIDGQVSNFKLYDVVLEASEVQKLYRLGRTGRSMVISDTAVGIGKVPEAQLDVRGVVSINNITPYGYLQLNQGNRPGESSSTHGMRWTNTDNANYWQLYNSSNDHFRFSYNGAAKGWVDPNDPNVQMNFTGQHRTFIKDVPFSQVGELEGLIVSSDQNKYIKMSGGIEVGSNAITTNESLPVVSLSNVVTDKKCFGVISASEDPENRTEQYGAFGTNFEKEKGDTRVYINSVGEGAIWVTNINGTLESGDYITTSNVAGYGQKQESDSLKNYTVAKITMDCDFEPVTQPIQHILRSNVVQTYYLGNVHKIKSVPHAFVTTTVTADDTWSNVSVSPSDVTYMEWSNLEANTQNTYTLTYTQTSNVVYDTKYTLTTTENVTESDQWDRVSVDPPDVTYMEYSNLEANTQSTYTLTFTQTTTDEKTPAAWSILESNTQSLYNEVFYQSVEEEVASEYPGATTHTRVTDMIENELDVHGQIQWEDHPTETEKAYKIRYLDANGVITDETNAVHTAAFVGCTYHCG